MRPLLTALLLALPTALSAQDLSLTAADSALVGRILLAEDRRDGRDRALADGMKHRSAQIRTIAERARGRVADPHYTKRNTLPPLPAPSVWPEPAWRLRFRALSADSTNCAALAAALADSMWAVRLHAADLLPPSCAGNDATVATLHKWIDALSPTAAGRSADGVYWQAAAHAIVALARLAPADARTRLGALATHRQWQVRLYTTRAAAVLADTTRLRVLGRDADDNVKEAAITALSKLTGHADDAVYLAALSATGAQAVRAAAIALKGSPRKDVRPAANAIFQRWVGRGIASARDARLALLDAAGRPAREDHPPVERHVLPRDAVALALGRDLRLRVTLAPSSGGGTFDVRLRGDVAPIMARARPGAGARRLLRRTQLAARGARLRDSGGEPRRQRVRGLVAVHAR